MPECVKNIHEAATVAVSAPGPDEMLLWVSPNGTSVFRKQSVMGLAAMPDDARIAVTASGGTINGGDSAFTLAQFAGFRVRLYRNYQLQDPVANDSGYSYGYTRATGAFTITPAAAAGEILQVQAY